MNHFEWVDPKDTLDAQPARGRPRSRRIRRIQPFGRLWQQIQDLPRHLGQHSGGMVMCQGRLDDVVPLENASMPDRVVVQWDKDDCADMGIVKVDLLGLGMMAVLQDALELVNRERGSRTRDRRSGRAERRAPRLRPRTRMRIRRRSRPPAPRRSRGLSHAAGGRHDRHLPGRIARADGDAAAAAPEALLRHRRRGGDHPARARSSARWCIRI